MASLHALRAPRCARRRRLLFFEGAKPPLAFFWGATPLSCWALPFSLCYGWVVYGVFLRFHIFLCFVSFHILLSAVCVVLACLPGESVVRACLSEERGRVSACGVCPRAPQLHLSRCGCWLRARRTTDSTLLEVFAGSGCCRGVQHCRRRAAVGLMRAGVPPTLPS